MYRTAVHNWMLNSLFEKWRPRMPQDFAPFHTCFYLANVTDEINSFRVSGELCLRLKFRARSDQQHELFNNLTFWWYYGLCFKITNLEKMSRLKKASKITQHANTLTKLEVTRFQHCRQCGLRMVLNFSYVLFEVIRLFHGMWKHSQSYMWWSVVLMK